MKTLSRPDLAPAVFRWHKLGSHGGFYSAAAIARAVKICRTLPPSTYFPKTLNGEGGTASEVLRQFGRYCMDQINRRGGLTWPDETPAAQSRQFRRLCQRARPSTCKWCGSNLGRFIPQEFARFCDPSCSCSYRN